MAKAVFHREFNVTDSSKGVSVRVLPSDAVQSHPEWIIAAAEEAGAATREATPAAGAAKLKKD